MEHFENTKMAVNLVQSGKQVNKKDRFIKKGWKSLFSLIQCSNKL